MINRLWALVAFGLAGMVVVPLCALLWLSWQTDFSHWQSLWAYVLPSAIQNTFILLLGVGGLSLMLGTASAWLVTQFDFVGRNPLIWLLLLPLSVPTYLIAYAYLDLLHPIGPIQTLIRSLLGYDSPRQLRLPDIRQMLSAIVLLSFVLYPYVYLSVRALLMRQSVNIIESARCLGYSRFGVFWHLTLPLIRPAMVVGLSLVLLETLNDIGASEFLGIQTLTVTVYDTWVTRGNLPAAAQIALTTLLVVFLLMLIERRSRAQQHLANLPTHQSPAPQKLTGWAGRLALALGLIPFALGFAIPVGYLLVNVVRRPLNPIIWQQWSQALINTLQLALAATLLCVIAGLIVAGAAKLLPKLTSNSRPAPNYLLPPWPFLRQFLRRFKLMPYAQWLVLLASLGYAIPGTVLAIGLMAPLGFIDQILTDVWGGESLWVLNTFFALVMAYVLRFLSISNGSFEAGFARISPTLIQATQSLGEKPAGVLMRVLIPIMKPSIITAAILVFVDSMKELPMTLMMRPINFETLATLLYADASRGQYADGAWAALTIVVAGLIPVLWLSRRGMLK